ncbi:MAG: GntR family transcriptional regulator [Terrimicrobiaceae bacterium]
MRLSISTNTGEPIFRQIVGQVSRMVYRGQLRVGDELSSVRVLAEELGVNPNTVARAYQELVQGGLLESRPGRGFFVGERRNTFSDEERARRLDAAVESFLQEAAFLGTPASEIKAALNSKLKSTL